MSALDEGGVGEVVRGLDIVELSRGIFASGCKHRMLAVLWGYFDESGTDNQLGHTVIAGFVGTPRQWARFTPQWERARNDDGVDVFHYSACVSKKDCYVDWDYLTQIQPHLEKMADVLCGHNLIGVGVRHVGKFDEVMARHPGWEKRFPSPYSLLFEMLIHLFEVYLPGQDIALFMGRHPEFTKRTREVYDRYKFDGLWPNIRAYIDVDKEVAAAQAADMIAYETRRFSWKQGDEKYWHTQPLLSRWIPLCLQGKRRLEGIGFDDVGLHELAPTTTFSFIRGAAKARRRWTAMAERGTAMALSMRHVA